MLGLMSLLAILLMLSITSIRGIIEENEPEVIHAVADKHIVESGLSAAVAAKPLVIVQKTPWAANYSRPFVIAHRGASGELPEHTLAAYKRAIEQGADFIECDIVLTKDLQPVCRHEPNLNDTTDAWRKFPNLLRTYVIDGTPVTGIFTIDLTLAQVKSLRVMQPWPFRDQSYNFQFEVPTLEEYIAVALGAPRVVGIYPETKHPTWFNSQPALKAANTTLEEIVLATISKHNYNNSYNSPAWRQKPIFLQSFEGSSLRYMGRRTCAPLVLLMGGLPGYRAPDTNLTHELMSTDVYLDKVAKYATAVGPGKASLAVWQDGKEGQTGSYRKSMLLEKLQAKGLQVHPYAFRNEAQFIVPQLGNSSDAEYELFLQQLGVQGVFSDFPGTANKFIQTKGPGGKWNTEVMGKVKDCRLLPSTERIRMIGMRQ